MVREGGDAAWSHILAEPKNTFVKSPLGLGQFIDTEFRDTVVGELLNTCQEAFFALVEKLLIDSWAQGETVFVGGGDVLVGGTDVSVGTEGVSDGLRGVGDGVSTGSVDVGLAI